MYGNPLTKTKYANIKSTSTSKSDFRMHETDKSRLSLVCLGVSMLCLWVALLLSNVVFQVKHAWNFGWLGSLIAFIICRFSPDSRTRADAEKVFGVGVCVTFYAMKYGHPQLHCRFFSSAACSSKCWCS